MPALQSGMLGLFVRRHIVTIASALALVVVVATLTVFAVRSPGFPVQKADLNDGGVWVTNQHLESVGREDKPVSQLNLQLFNEGDSGANLDVLQNAQAVISWNATNGQLTPIDASDGSNSSGAAKAAITNDVSLGGDVVAVADPSGKVWATHVDTAGGTTSLADLDESAKPLLKAGAGAYAAVSTTGETFVASTKARTITRVPDVSGGFGTPVTAKLDPAPAPSSSIASLTTVGDTPVWLDSANVMGVNGGHTRTLGSDSALQQPGPASGTVLAETQRSLLAVDLSDVEASSTLATIGAGGRASAAQPVEVGGCAWGLWYTFSTGYVSETCPGMRTRSVEPFATDGGELVFRVNRDALVVNDIENGDVWDVSGAKAVEIAHWDSQSSRAHKRQQKNTVKVKSQQKAAPVARTDDLGARAGVTTVLHVLDNDSAPKGTVLSIRNIPNGNPDLHVAVAPDQQSILATVDQGVGATTLSFHYTVDDGERTNNTATGQVNLTVHPASDQGHAKPALRSDYTAESAERYVVAAGQDVTMPVVSDWRDRSYGDPIVLVPGSVKASPGVASITPDGLLRYEAPSKFHGAVKIRYQVYTGGPKATGSTTVHVYDGTETAPPTAEPDVVAGVVGSPIVIHPLDNDLPGADQLDPTATLALAADVAPVDGLKVATNLGAGTVTVTAPSPHTYTLSYRDKYGLGSGTSTGMIKVVVSPATDASNKPIPSPDSTVVHGYAPSIVDVLANDYDEKGRLLAVTSATPRNDGGKDVGKLDVSVIAGRWIRVASRSGDFGARPVVVDYTVSNGDASATSTLTVSQLPAVPAADDAPDAEPDMATVRAGSSVVIPVLDNDSTPSGDPVGLVVDQSVKVGTLPMIDGPGTAYLDGNEVRYVAPATVKGPVDAHFVYPVANLSQPGAGQATGVVTVHVVPARSHSNPDQAPAPPDLEARVAEGGTVTIKLPDGTLDPDGDPVTVTAVGDPDVAGGMPELGTVSAFSADTITYQAFPGTPGADSFAYQLTDPFGESAEGLVQVTVVQPGTPQAPVAVDDSVTVDPAKTLVYNVLANDLFQQGVRPEVEPLTGAPHGVTEKGGFVTVKAGTGKDGETLAIPYTDTNGISTSTATLSVHFQKGYDNPPTANPVAAKPGPHADTVTTDVLKKVTDIDDPTSALRIVSVDGRPASAISGGKVTLPVTARPSVWTYHVADSSGAEAVGSIYVAGRSPDTPYLKPGSVLRMKAGATTTVHITDYVGVDDADLQPYLTTTDRMSGHPASMFAGSVSAPTDQSLKVTAGSQGGEAALAFQVSTSKSLNAKGAGTATIVLPVVITAPHQSQPQPRITCPSTPISVPAYGSTTVNFGAVCTIWQASTDTRTLSYDASLTSSLPGVKVSTSATSADLVTDGANANDRGSLTVSIRGVSGASAQVPFVITAPARASLSPIQPVSLDTGQSTTIDLRPLLQSPLPQADQKPVILGVSAQHGAPAMVTASGTSLKIDVPSSAKAGTYEYTVRMSDSGSSTRAATGTLQVTVKTAPTWPTGTQVTWADSQFAPESEKVKLHWTSASPNGSPITDYIVNGGGHSTDCGPVNDCTITGLTNGVTYAFTVVAVNGVGKSVASPPVSATPDQVPTAPTDLTVTSESDGAITYSWAEPKCDCSAIQGYSVSSDSGNRHWEQVDGTSATIQVPNGAPVTFEVRAFDKLGPTMLGAPAINTSGIASGKPQPPAVTSITGTNLAGNPGVKVFHVSWDQVAANGRGSTSYELEENGSPVTCGGGSWTSSTSCDVQDANDGKTYTFAVLATNAAGNPGTNQSIEGSPSSYWSASGASMQAEATGQVQGFSALTATATGRTGEVEVDFTVGASEGATGVVSCVAPSPSCTADTIGAAGGSGTIKLEGLPNGTSVTITLQYCNTAGGGSDNSTLGTQRCVSSTGNPQAVPYGPIQSPTISASANGNVVTVSASADPNGRSVTLTITRNGATIGSCSSGQYYTGTFSCPTISDTVSYRTTYTYAVTASDNGSWSRSSVSASTQATTGEPPVSVSVSRSGNKVVSYGDPPCTTSGCPIVYITISGFPDSVSCTANSSFGSFTTHTYPGTYSGETYGPLVDDDPVGITCTDVNDSSLSASGSG